MYNRKRFGNLRQRWSEMWCVENCKEDGSGTNRDIICEHYTRNDDGISTFSDVDKNIAWESYHEKRLKTVFEWDRQFVSGKTAAYLAY